ncbi:MAG: glycosyltransferase family A protein [Cyanobacteriota bacterium]|nr:glycosyltransferase family A protein [Cyanobacteriota bacterium]
MTHCSPSLLPLVSVVIPTYNAEAFIERTLNAVLAQTYQNLEILVVNDGSRDRTAEIVSAIAQCDRRVIVLEQPNSGVAAARNLGIQHARGEFIAPIDADDLWYPQNLEKQVQCFLHSDPNVGLVYAWSVDIDKNDNPTGEFRAAKIEGNVYKTLICHNFLGNASATLMRRSCLEQIGGYNSQLREQKAQGCEDWDLYLRLAERYPFRVVPEFLIGYRKIPSSMSRDYRQMARSHRLMLQAVRQKSPQIPAVLYRLSCSSFYLYLARQSHQYGSPSQTLFWLREAIRADFITPLWRYGWYLLLLKSLWQLWVPPARQPLQRQATSQARALTVADLNQRKLSISFKLLVGSVLHRGIKN